jgi:hypothetical protein
LESHTPYLSEYAGQSIDELIAMEGDFRLDSLVLAVEQAIGAKSWREGDAALSDAEGVVRAVKALQREMSNGGYWQFFVSSAGEFLPSIVAALRRIGCPITAEAIARAMDAYGVTDSMTAEEVAATVQDREVSEQQSLNMAYFGSGEDLTASLFEFVKANREAILIP